MAMRDRQSRIREERLTLSLSRISLASFPLAIIIVLSSFLLNCNLQF